MFDAFACSPAARWRECRQLHFQGPDEGEQVAAKRTADIAQFQDVQTAHSTLDVADEWLRASQSLG